MIPFILCAVYFTNIRFACNIIIIMICWKMFARSLCRVRSSKQINNAYLFLCFFRGWYLFLPFLCPASVFKYMFGMGTLLFVDVIISVHNILLLLSSMLKFTLWKLNQKLFYNSILNMVSVCIFCVECKQDRYFIVVVSVAPYDQVHIVHRYISVSQNPLVTEIRPQY